MRSSLLPERKGNITSSPNSHTLFPRTSSYDKSDSPWEPKPQFVTAEKEESAFKEESLEARNCWDANKCIYLSYIVISILLDGSQSLKQNKTKMYTCPFHIRLSEYIKP